MQTIKVFISKSGNIKIIGTNLLTENIKGDKIARRASHIVPCSTIKYILFKIIRWISGDNKRFHSLVQWTRTWNCQWIIDLRPIGDCLYKTPFGNRADAIKYEHYLLEEILKKGLLT